MAFSTKQLRALNRNVEQRYIRTRESNGRELSYIEGWYAISQANRIFGFDGWNRETIESRCVLARDNRGVCQAVYIARVRITVRSEGGTVLREGHGTGEGRGASPGEVHDMAWKAAETDATKRALATFGKPFGLELYRNGTNQAVKSPPPQTRKSGSTPRGLHPDDTTPIPRPSRYYGRRHYLEAREAGGVNSLHLPMHQSTSDPSIVPREPPGRIDKSALTLSEPKRLRDKGHLRFVASHPCLICGRQPSDPHHLRFAQPRAIGLKVSDEFTVPLCRTHHRQLHQTGNEVSWWQDFKISPLEVARGLWEESRGQCRTPEPQMNSEPITPK